MWNRTPEWHKLSGPPYGALSLVTIGFLASNGVPVTNSPNAMTIQANWVQLSVPSEPDVTATTMPAWWVQPERPRGAVLVLPEVFV